MLNSEGETKNNNLHESQKKQTNSNQYKIIESDIDKVEKIQVQPPNTFVQVNNFTSDNQPVKTPIVK